MDIRVDVIIPCRNEVHYVESMIDSILAQDYPAHLIHIYVVDGMSEDGTTELLFRIKERISQLTVLLNKKKTVPAGMNLAINMSNSEVVIRMDCHSEYPTNYISILVNALLQLEAENVGLCIETLPQSSTSVAKGIALALSSEVGVGSSKFRLGAVRPEEVDTVPFGCFKRSIFSKIGLYDEDLVRNQDDELNSRIIKFGGKIYLLPGPKIKYFARGSFVQTFRMFYQYGLFKPLSNYKSGRIVSIRQLAPPAFVLVNSFFLIASFFSIGCLVILSGLMSIYLFVLLLFYTFKRVTIPVILSAIFSTTLMHVGYGVGFIEGMLRVILGWRGSEVSLTR